MVTKTLIDEQATKANIEKELQSLQEQTRALDVSVFFFSGHGATEESDPSGRFYLFPVDGDRDNLGAPTSPARRSRSSAATPVETA